MAGRILVVEPSESSQRTLELTLHAEFLDVVTVATAAEALERLAQDEFSMVLAAVQLGQSSGSDLLRKVRSDPATAAVPNLLLGEDVEALQEAVRGGGIDGILGKPFRSKDLVDQVYRLMRDPGTGTLPGSLGLGDDDAQSARGARASADDPDSAEIVDEGAGGGGSFFDLAGELDRGDSVAAKRPEGLRERAQELADEIGFGTGDRTVVVSRDDLAALRSGMGMPGRGGKPEAKPEAKSDHTMMMSREELNSQLKSKKPEGDEVSNYQTMMMSRDELADLRGKLGGGKTGPRPTASARATPVGGVPVRDTGSVASGTNPYSAATVRPKSAGAPGSEESIEAMLRGAVHSTEEELLRVLQKIRPDMADAVKKVAHQLVDRIARRVALEVASKRVEEEIARIRKSLR